jgi:hypothetical protein
MSAQPEQTLISASERLLRSDLAEAGFEAGVDRGYWRLAGLAWPNAIIEIAAAPRPGAPDWFALLFDLTGYPQAPTSRLWDLGAGTPLARQLWPSGGLRVAAVFNPDWRDDALYVPVDRLALEGHEGWLVKHACHAWDPAGDLTQYLRLIHELLNDDSYAGCRG